MHDGGLGEFTRYHDIVRSAQWRLSRWSVAKAAQPVRFTHRNYDFTDSRIPEGTRSDSDHAHRNARGAAIGHWLTRTEHPRADQNREYLIRRTRQ